MKARLSLVLAFAACAVVSTHAAGDFRTIEVESLRITFDSQWADRTAPGYLPVRFEIVNLGDARVVELVAAGSRFFRGGRLGWQGGTTVRQAVRLARGDRVKFTMPVPAFGDNENIRFELYEEGRLLERFNWSSFQSRLAANDAAVLLVADAGSAFANAVSSWPRMSASATGSGFTTVFTASGSTTSGSTTIVGAPSSVPVPLRVPVPTVDFILETPRLPSNWLGYTSLRAVVLGAAEWGKLDDGQKSALLGWTACGGDLVVVDGEPGAILPGESRPAAAASNPARAYFFGRIHLPTLATVTTAGLPGTLTALAPVQDSNFSLPVNRTSDWGVIAERGFRLPIPGVGGVPARSYLTILLTFAVFIGPINYWLLRRAGRQVLLVLTTPIVSAVFLVLLAGYVLAGEGLGVRGRAATVTLLDQARKQAVTRASISLYAAGMTPSGGLRFPRDVAVFPIGPEGTGSRDQHTLDLSESQRFATGVIQARAPTNLEELVVRPARERLGFSPDGSGVAVVNGLGARVTALVYRRGGTLYMLPAPLAAGGKATLKSGTVRAADVVPAGLPLTARLQHLFEHVPEGAYLAVLERSPFWEPGVPSVDERGSFHVVIGWPEGQPS